MTLPIPRLDSRGLSPTSTGSRIHSPEKDENNISGIPSPVTSSQASKPRSSGYITVDEANKMRKNSVVSDPRAYSKVAIAPMTASASSKGAVVMSAKDLHVQTKPPYKQVVTSLDDGNTATKATMV